MALLTLTLTLPLTRHLDSQSKLWLSAEDGCEGVYPPRAKVLGIF